MEEMVAQKVASIPKLIYGTAWKKDSTRTLVHQALKAGFRGVDTAAQPRHYQEDLVGEGMRDAINEGIVKREDLYIQTKFTSVHGQDPARMPYNSKESISDQIAASVKSSLHNLRPTDDQLSTSYLDCLVMHSPLPTLGQTQEAWQAMETHVPHSARTLGMSNIYQPEILQVLYEQAKVKPSVVQNRFYPDTGYDTEIRSFCKDKGIIYQSFWTLTGNPGLLISEPVEKLARAVGVSDEVALYGLVLGLGEHMRVLDGTKNERRMREDLEGVEKIREWAEKNGGEWEEILKGFRGLVRQR